MPHFRLLSNRAEVWRLHIQADAYSKPPAELVGIRNTWLAYQFNGAVIFYGRYVEGKLNERDDDGKPIHSIENILSGQGEKSRDIGYRMAALGVDVLDM